MLTIIYSINFEMCYKVIVGVLLMMNNEFETNEKDRHFVSRK